MVRFQDGSTVIGDLKTAGEQATLTGKYGTLTVKAESIRTFWKTSRDVSPEKNLIGRYLVLLRAGNELRGNVKKDGEDFVVTWNSNKMTVAKQDIRKIITLAQPVKTLPAEIDKASWYVVTLKDGSALRGTVTRGGDGYTITFRFGELKVKPDDVFAFEKVEHVFANPAPAAGSPRGQVAPR